MPATDNNEVFTSFIKDLEDSDISVLCLCGELDASSVPAFLADAQEVVERCKHVIMDVHLLDYVDSTGVAAMVSTRHALDAAGLEVYVAGCHGLLSKVLHITQAETELQCVDDVEEAVEQIRAKQTMDPLRETRA